MASLADITGREGAADQSGALSRQRRGEAALPADWRDFVALAKPRVMSLVVFTGLAGLVAAPDSIHPLLGFVAVLCIALAAGAAGAPNQWWEADTDRPRKDRKSGVEGKEGAIRVSPGGRRYIKKNKKKNNN